MIKDGIISIPIKKDEEKDKEKDNKKEKTKVIDRDNYCSSSGACVVQ